MYFKLVRDADTAVLYFCLLYRGGAGPQCRNNISIFLIVFICCYVVVCWITLYFYGIVIILLFIFEVTRCTTGYYQKVLDFLFFYVPKL